MMPRGKEAQLEAITGIKPDEIPSEILNRMEALTTWFENENIQDDYCPRIVRVLCNFYPKTMGFNELLKNISEKAKSSPTALVKHLSHLEESGIIVRGEDPNSNYRAGKTQRKKSVIQLSPKFIEVGKDILLRADGLSQQKLLEEFENIPIDVLTQKLVYILFNDVLDALKYSLMDKPDYLEVNNQTLYYQIGTITHAFHKYTKEKKIRGKAWDYLAELNGKVSDFTNYK